MEDKPPQIGKVKKEELFRAKKAGSYMFANVQDGAKETALLFRTAYETYQSTWLNAVYNVIFYLPNEGLELCVNSINHKVK